MKTVVMLYDCGCNYEYSPIRPVLVVCKERQVDEALMLGRKCAPTHQCHSKGYRQAIVVSEISELAYGYFAKFGFGEFKEWVYKWRVYHIMLYRCQKEKDRLYHEGHLDEADKLSYPTVPLLSLKKYFWVVKGDRDAHR